MDHKQIDVLQAQVKHLFTDHPAEVGETYLQHFSFTLKTSLRLLWSGFILFLHGVFPFLFTHTASNLVEKLYLLLKSRIPKARREKSEGDYNI